MNLYRLLRICLQTAEILAASYYILLRFTQVLPKKSTGRKIIFATISFFSALTILTIVLRNCNLGAWYLPLQTFEYTWVILLVGLLLLTLTTDAFRFAMYLSKCGRIWLTKHDIKMRRIAYPIIVFLSAITVAYGFVHFTKPVIKEVTFNIRKPVPNWKIVAVSDLHCGTMSAKTLQKHVNTINNLHPDLILLLGDQSVVNWQDLQTMGYADILQQLQASRGIFAVNGNHEFIHGYVHNSNPDFRQWADNFSIVTLEDSAITIDNQLVLIGRDDTSTVHRKMLSTLLCNVDTTLPVIVMDHSPLDIHSATANHIDIQLSGHTHNGQILPVSLIGKIKSFLKGGLFYGYQQRGETQFYVSAGLGGSGAPIRIGTYGEIVIINLKYAD